MYEKEEKQLKTLYDNIQVPLDSLDEAIFTGFQKAKTEEKRQFRGKKWVISVAAAAIFLVGFFTSIRISPAFADYISVIPGMEKIVNLIRTDKGRMLAIENDYYEKIGVSQEKSGLKFTIDGVIADESQLVLFYTITSKDKQKLLKTEKVRLESLEGKSIELGGISMGSPLNSEKGATVHSDMFEFYFQSPLQAKKLQLKVWVKGEKVKEEFTVNFELKKDIQLKKSFDINQTITMEGQKITFLNADIYPLRAAIHVKMDPNNSKRILSFADLRLVDENGETWNKINNGIIANLISPDEAVIYLQSNYFREPKELYLVFNKIQAVDKDEAFVVVDTVKRQILKQPKGNLLRNLRVEGNQLIFELQTKKEFNAFLFTRINDGNGKEISSNYGFTEGNDKGITKLGVSIPNPKNLTNPISLELSAYPTWIKGNEKIKVK
ncbi:DUF4179 domain-containing protein [Neobacillus kokaensis]|uniref:DUF4179 domain-containing protein n=1 Tax=Neobacillus kokaensis TaxID=2759023 RepID=A0ABQ3NB70_9BACI|nr:DUF4179 domain-containing protein [Neobacillus kokaensis]GHI01158.1 hypothetical protein AM1BK_47000 [Neobacillus kokaensis]